MTATLDGLTIAPDVTPGYEVVRLEGVDGVFAVLHHPQASRRWHITYAHRRGTPPHSSHKTRQGALDELLTEVGAAHLNPKEQP